ncbi:hypothetical protein U1Q18_033567 [Sarracenia purpurea var. burkii]
MRIGRTKDKGLLNNEDFAAVHGCWLIFVYSLSGVFTIYELTFSQYRAFRGIAVYLTQEVINNAIVDSITRQGDGTSTAWSKASDGVLLQSCQKKRKHAGTNASLGEQPERLALEVGVTKNATPISVKIAALEALEALLTVIAVTEQVREGRNPSTTLGGYVRADFPLPTASHGNGDSRSKPAPQS